MMISILRNTRAAAQLALCLVGASGGFSAAQAQAPAPGALAQLYAARPPAEMAYVRVISADAQPVQVQIADAPAETLSRQRVASNYAIVKGDTRFHVLHNGQSSPALQVAPGSYSSVVLDTSAKPAQWVVIADTAGNADALKASLHFYNLVPGCGAAQLQVAPSGPALFNAVKAQAVQSRSINPVRAQLQGSCQQAASAPLDLPALQPSEHYSLFLLGSAEQPVLQGQLSSTNPYRP